jgi:hypothetical protein
MKSLSKCQVFLCQHKTRSGKPEKDLTERYCRYHHPEQVAHLHRIRPNTNVSTKGPRQLYGRERVRATDHDHAFERAKLELAELQSRIATREARETEDLRTARELLASRMKGSPPPAARLEK